MGALGIWPPGQWGLDRSWAEGGGPHTVLTPTLMGGKRSEADGPSPFFPTPLQAGLKYWGPTSPTHKLPPSFAGNKDGEGWAVGTGAQSHLEGQGAPHQGRGSPGVVG